MLRGIFNYNINHLRRYETKVKHIYRQGQTSNQIIQEKLSIQQIDLKKNTNIV